MIGLADCRYVNGKPWPGFEPLNYVEELIETYGFCTLDMKKYKYCLKWSKERDLKYFFENFRQKYPYDLYYNYHYDSQSNYFLTMNDLHIVSHKFK
jgi:hypothetical protein